MSSKKPKKKSTTKEKLWKTQKLKESSELNI